MHTQVQFADIAVDVVRKRIKNVHLSVHPPTGRVSIAAPLHMNLDTIRVFAIAKLGWIRQQQKKLREQERETPREYLNRESHYVWGRRYLLKLIEADLPASVWLTQRQLVMRTHPNWHIERKQELLDSWYRQELKLAVPDLIAKWHPLIGAKPSKWFVQRMKTKWGSCNADARTIRINTELAKKPRECLEYIVVHELVHLREPTHNARFIALMNQFMPHWRSTQELLNRLPARHESWGY
jgi:predicted metal-dependent hydrolase